MNAQILINCGSNWFEFSRSKTGQLDYVGKLENDLAPDVKNYQEISSSSYFSPTHYVYLDDSLNNNPKIYVAPGVDVSDKDIFDYLVHVGPLLSAVEAKDSLLAGDLYLKRQDSFNKFQKLTSYIMSPICVEIFFSSCFGKMKVTPFNCLGVIFEDVKKKLGYDSSKETIEQAVIRYIKNNEMTVTLPLVGTKFYWWDIEPEVLDKLSDNLGCDDILKKAEKIRKAKHDLYSNLEVSVQAEPYNVYDVNSILVSIEDIEEKISGNPGMVKAGHLRADAAQMIREAKNDVMSFRSKLASVSHSGIVVQVEVNKAKSRT